MKPKRQSVVRRYNAATAETQQPAHMRWELIRGQQTLAYGPSEESLQGLRDALGGRIRRREREAAE